MLEEVLQKHAFNCGLSSTLQKKTSIIIEILEKCSSGLSASKHAQLIEFMKLKICNPDNIKVQKTITNNIKKWKNDDLSKMIKFIGTYFHLVNQAELDEIIFINAERDRISNHLNPNIDIIADDALGEESRIKLITFLNKWLVNHIKEVLGDLIKLTKYQIKNQYLRGLLFQLYENNGVIKRSEVNRIVKLIPAEE